MSQAGQEVVFLCLTKAAWYWLVTCRLTGKDRKLYSFACDMWISIVTWSVLACLSSGEAWKLVSRASVKGLLLSSGTFVHGSISEGRGLYSPPASPDGNPVEDIEQAIASEWTRVEDTYETNGETGQPLWTEIFRHILKECAYLTAFHTVYVMVDTRNLKAHETAQDLTGRQQWRGGTVVFNWWGPIKRKRSFFIFRPLKRLAFTGCIPPGQGHLS